MILTFLDNLPATRPITPLELRMRIVTKMSDA